MNKYLKGLVEEREALATAIQTLTDKAAVEDRDLSDNEMVEVRKIQERCTEIDSRLDTFGTAQESNKRYAELMGRIEVREGKKVEERKVEAASWGASFIGSEEFRNYNGRGISGAVEVPFETRATLSTGTSNIPLAIAGFSPKSAEDRFPLLSTVSKETVSSGSIEWVEVSAAPTAAVQTEGLAKQEAALTFTPKTASLDTLAHWIPMTRQAMEDSPRLQSIVDGKLRTGLLKKIETDLATVIMGATGTLTNEALVTSNLLASIRVGVGKVEAAGYFADAVLLNPADYAALDVANLNDSITSRGSFWGLKVIPSSGVTAGTAVVVDSAAITLFQKGSAQVLVADQHSDFFVKNTLVVLAETRVKSVVTAPQGVCFCTVAAA